MSDLRIPPSYQCNLKWINNKPAGICKSYRILDCPRHQNLMQIIPGPEGIMEAVFPIPLPSKLQNLQKDEILPGLRKCHHLPHGQLLWFRKVCRTGNQASASEAATLPHLQGEALQLDSQPFPLPPPGTQFSLCRLLKPTASFPAVTPPYMVLLSHSPSQASSPLPRPLLPSALIALLLQVVVLCLHFLWVFPLLNIQGMEGPQHMVSVQKQQP